MSEASVLWRRVDAPGHDACRLARDGDGWRLSGAAVFAHESAPVRLDYEVHADAAWRTRRATVSGWVGGDAVRVEAQVDEGGRWTVDGRDRPDLAGCVDVDLAFTPATNLLPIRRLAPRAGQEARIAAAWFPFPGLAARSQPQAYRRIDAGTYRFDHGDGEFTAVLRVDGSGFVTTYPGLWEAEGPVLVGASPGARAPSLG